MGLCHSYEFKLRSDLCWMVYTSNPCSHVGTQIATKRNRHQLIIEYFVQLIKFELQLQCMTK